MVLIATLLLAAVPAAGGEVRLPLRDYVALVDAAERASRRPPETDPTVARLVSQETRVVVDDTDVAEITVVAEAELRGAALQPVAIALPGAAWSATVEPPTGAVVGRARDGLSLVPTRPGRYRVVARARARLGGRPAARTLTLPPSSAAAAQVVADLPAGMAWSCARAVVVSDEVVGERRRVSFTHGGAAPVVLELRRQAKGAEEDRALARAVVVTLLDVGRDSVRRHDLLLHEVQRGELVSLEARLPEGYEPDVVATDEGSAVPLREGRALTVERQKRLTATGFLALSTRLTIAADIPLPAVEPGVPLRARYVAVSSTRVATASPQPPEAWVRVDLLDLPEPLRGEAAALGIVAAWRERPGTGARSMALDVPPAALLAAAPIRKRTTTSLLTTEGRVLHKDEFLLDSPTPEALVLDIGDATFWSAEVDGEAVAPASTSGRLELPLMSTGSAVTVQVVTVRAVPLPREGVVELALARLDGPVLLHEWRLLLPDERRYRLRQASLRRAPLDPVGSTDPQDAILSGIPTSVAHGPGGDGGIRGIVVDTQGAAVPGASVTVLSRDRTVASLVSDPAGLFLVDRLQPGRYKVKCSLTGFMEATVDATLHRRSVALPTCHLRVGSVQEVVTVTGEAPIVDVSSTVRGATIRPDDPERSRAAFADEAEELRQGLVGGVRPVDIEVPDEGKALALAGALPGPAVSATLEVRPGS
jgi:hypothetical protein